MTDDVENDSKAAVFHLWHYCGRSRGCRGPPHRQRWCWAVGGFGEQRGKSQACRDSRVQSCKVPACPVGKGSIIMYPMRVCSVLQSGRQRANASIGYVCGLYVLELCAELDVAGTL
jgi:hypothetical protein